MRKSRTFIVGLSLYLLIAVLLQAGNLIVFILSTPHTHTENNILFIQFRPRLKMQTKANETQHPTKVNLSLGTESPVPQNDTEAELLHYDYEYEEIWPEPTRPLLCDNCFHTDFPVLLENRSICKVQAITSKVDVIMLIITRHTATQRREVIRYTWASETRKNTANLRHVFVLGRSLNTKHMQMVEQEHLKHGDLLMVDFVDSYKNLTLKTLSALSWVVNNCGIARYFLKADDDTWVNIPGLLHVLKNHSHELQTAIIGHCRNKSNPIRNKKSRYYASLSSYPHQHYPGLCNGPTYLSSLSMARRLLTVSPNVPFFHLEDVYLSFCVQHLGKPFHLKNVPGFLVRSVTLCSLKSLATISRHGLRPRQLWQVWYTVCPIARQKIHVVNRTTLGP